MTATDPDSDTVRYSLLDGNDSSLFAIEETSGELFYVGAGEDYESGVTSYELTVQASDGTHASAAAVTVALGDVRGHSEPEGGDLPNDRTTTGMVLVDEAPVTGNIESTWDLDWFAVELVAGRTYRIDFRGQPTGDGTLVDPFLYGVFDGDGRLIRGTTSPDGGTSYNSRLVFTAPGEGRYYIATSGNGTYPSGTGTYELEVRDVRAPVFAESGYRFALSENAEGSVNRQSLGTVTATDPDGGTVRYRLVGGDESRRFAIDPDTGEVFYVGPGEDYESRVTSHELRVRASDGAYSTEVTVTVTVTDVAEAPAFEEERYAFALAENTDGSDNRLALGAVAATDPDGDAVRYSLSGGNDSELFAIGETSGELYYVGGGEDDESGATTYELTVQASDGTHPVDTMVTVTVVDNPFDSEKSTGPQGSSEPASEDLPAGRETSGEVRVDAEPVDGTLRSPSDRDWFAVTLAPGRTYVFALEGDAPRGGTGAAPAIRGLRDANGNPVAGIVGGTEVRYATDGAAAEAVYYIEVGGEGGSGQGTSATRGVGARSSVATRSIVETRSSSDGGTGYRLRANDITETRDATDDYRSDTSTTGVVTVGGSVTGEIERSGDHDWFAVDLVEGRLYRIDLKGRSTGDGTLKDPYLRGVHDDNGVLLDGTRNDDGGVGRNSRVVFTAPADATYYLAAGALAAGALLDRKGTYALSVTEVHDDFVAGTGTSGTLEVGGSATGEIDYRGDRDWFAVTLEAGKGYRFDLKGEPTGDGTLPYPYIRGIYDADGDRIDSIAGAYSNFGSNPRYSRMDFVAPADDTYYVSAEAKFNGYFWRGGGTYTLSVTEVADDYASGTGTSGTVEVGGSATGEIDYRGDRDWFEVTLQAGKVYRFDLKGEPTGDGTLPYPYISGIYDADGDRIDGTPRAYRSHFGSNAKYSGMDFVAPADDTYYVSAEAKFNGYWWRGGTYTLSVTEVVDDYASGIGTTGTLAVGDSTTGAIDYVDDRDWFAVSLKAGTTYRFDLGEYGPRGDGTLGYVQIHGIYDSEGNRIVDAPANDAFSFFRDFDFFLYNQVVFTPDEDDTYYVSAGGDAGDRGTYMLSVTAIMDDYASDTDTTGTVTVGGSTTGMIEHDGDRDWFAVTLDVETTYRFRLLGRMEEPETETLWVPQLLGIHDDAGEVVDGTPDDGRIRSHMEFIADSPGTYYVSVGTWLSDNGTYTLSVEEVTDGM